jgi:hypothetical protein
VKQAPWRVRVNGFLLGVVYGVLSPVAAQGQADRYAPTVLQLPATPRAATQGAVAGSRDVESIFGNPAMVGYATGTVVGFGRYDAATHLSLANASSLGTFNVGIGAQYLYAFSQNDQVPLWSYSLHVGGHLPVSSAVGALALATTIRGMRAGATFKYVEQRHGSLRDGVPALDLGLAKDISRYNVGLTVQNIGAGIHFPTSSAQLPLRVSAGIAGYGFILGPFDVNGTAGASVLPDGLVLPAVGMELGYVPLEGYNFVVRAGIRRPELRAQRPVTVGASASLDRFALEYALEDWVGGATHRLALRVR